MDAKERRLTAKYNRILAELNRIPKGDPRHIRVSSRLIAALRELRAYQNRKNN